MVHSIDFLPLLCLLHYNNYYFDFGIKKHTKWPRKILWKKNNNSLPYSWPYNIKVVLEYHHKMMKQKQFILVVVSYRMLHFIPEQKQENKTRTKNFSLLTHFPNETHAWIEQHFYFFILLLNKNFLTKTKCYFGTQVV